MAIDAISKSENYFNEVTKKAQLNSNAATTKVDSAEVNISSKASAISFKDETKQEYVKDSTAEQKIKDAIIGANKKLSEKRTRCEFVYYNEVNRISIKVYDRETNEVIKEIPAEDSLETLEKIWSLAGLIIDEQC